jgi:hypothetical protein
MDRDSYGLGVTRESLVNRIIDHLVNAMMETPLAGIANIHSRTLSYRLQTFKNLDLVG